MLEVGVGLFGVVMFTLMKVQEKKLGAKLGGNSVQGRA